MLGATTGTLSYSAVPNSGKACHSFRVQRVTIPKHQGSVVDIGICYVFTQKWKTLQLFEILFFLTFIISFITDVRLARHSRNTDSFAKFLMKYKTESSDCYSSAAANHSGCFYCPCAMTCDPLQIYLTRFTVINIYHRNNDCEVGEFNIIMFIMRCCCIRLPTSIQISY